MGWSGMRNGELLDVAEHLFDVLITMDQNMRHQQHLPRYDLAVILLTSVSNRLQDTARMFRRSKECSLRGSSREIFTWYSIEPVQPQFPSNISPVYARMPRTSLPGSAPVGWPSR